MHTHVHVFACPHTRRPTHMNRTHMQTYKEEGSENQALQFHSQPGLACAKPRPPKVTMAEMPSLLGSREPVSLPSHFICSGSTLGPGVGCARLCLCASSKLLKMSEFYHPAQPLSTQVFASETQRLFSSYFPREPYIVHPSSLAGILLELNCSYGLLDYFVCGVDSPFAVYLL